MRPSVLTKNTATATPLHHIPLLTLSSLLSLVSALGLASVASAQVVQINSDEILRAHNQWRQNVGSPPLRWSTQLAGIAQNWANRLASEGAFYHSSSGYGENLFSISGRRATAQEAVDAWGSEIQYFQNGVFPNVSKTGNWADVGHYTQVVWSETTQVGCGVAGSSRFEVWVCNYDPPGNVTGRSPFGQNQPPQSPAPLPPTVPSTPIPTPTGGFFWERQFTRAAFPVGTENNQILYGCRAAHQGGIHPGKIIGNQCNFGFGGQEIRSSNYEILSFQGQSNGYRWTEGVSRGEQPVLGGQEANGTPLYLCRTSYQGGIHPGKLINGRCNIGYGGREVQLDRYEALVSQGTFSPGQPTNPSNPTNPTNPTLNTGFYWETQVTGQAFPVGTERNETLYSCRVAYQGGLHPGKLVGKNQCNFGFGGKEIESRNYQVLSFNGTTRYTWEQGSNANLSQSFIGGQEASGQPLAICRASYGGGVHPGKVVGNRCNIGYGGREVQLGNYEVLRLN